MATREERSALRHELQIARWQTYSNSLTAIGAVLITMAVTLITINIGNVDSVISFVFATTFIGGLAMMLAGFLLPHRVFVRAQSP